jgi:hypothetical protein
MVARTPFGEALPIHSANESRREPRVNVWKAARPSPHAVTTAPLNLLFLFRALQTAGLVALHATVIRSRKNVDSRPIRRRESGVLSNTPRCSSP